MKQITITLYGWSDFKKWLWDQFFFPRRKKVSSWLDYHNSEIKDKLVSHYIKSNHIDPVSDNDYRKALEFELSVKKILDEQTIITKELIMTKD